jgi:hypothetical protein
MKDAWDAEYVFGALRGAANSPAANSAQLSSLLLGLARRPVFKSHLKALVDSDEHLKQVAAASYSHALGFDKIVLMSELPFGRLRLHIWWPEVRRTLEHPHNHRYASHSKLVLGGLRTNTYVQSTAGATAALYREESLPGENRWTFLKIGPTHLSRVAVSEFRPGDCYFMSAETIHQVEAPSELTVTLFLEKRRVRDWSEVFIRPGDSQPRSAPQKMFTVSQLRDRLVRLQAILK